MTFGMGWTDEYTDETLKLWSQFEEEYPMWGHRMISYWATNWLTSNLSEYTLKNTTYDFRTQRDDVY